MQKSLTSLLVLALISMVFLAACGNETASQPTSISSNQNELTVYAAASLTEAFQEIAAAFTEKNEGSKVVFSFGGSSQLRSQIEQGAPAQVFASANEKEMDILVQKGLISGDTIVFARNSLVVIVPKANPRQIKDLEDLGKDGVRFIAAGPNVPAGAYWLQALNKMSANPEFGADFRERVTNNFISEETNVKQVVAKIQLGEGDAGVVYLTDITPEVAPDVQVIKIPERYNVTAEYPIGIVNGDEPSPLEQAFVTFVLSGEGRSILEKHGFLPGD